MLLYSETNEKKKKIILLKTTYSLAECEMTQKLDFEHEPKIFPLQAILAYLSFELYQILLLLQNL